MYYAGQTVILNLFVWTWLLVGVGRGVVVQVLIWACAAVAFWGWEYIANKRHERAYRRSHGLCASCGYDLQESTSLCPECGDPVPAGHRTRSALASDLERVKYFF